MESANMIHGTTKSPGRRRQRQQMSSFQAPEQATPGNSLTDGRMERLLPSLPTSYTSPSRSEIASSSSMLLTRLEGSKLRSDVANNVVRSTATSLQKGSGSAPKSQRPRNHRSCIRRYALLGPGVAIFLVLLRILASFFSMHTIYENGIRRDGRLLDAPFVRTHVPSLSNKSNYTRASYNARYLPNHHSMDLSWATEQIQSLEKTMVMQHKRRVERQRRTRPPRQIQGKLQGSMLKNPPRNRPAVNATTIHVATDHDDLRRPNQWKTLCQNARLSSSSHVVITHALTAELGPALALLLHQQCGVHRITAVDDLFPNVRSLRTTAMKVYRTLSRSIGTNLNLVVPTMGLSRRGDGLQWLYNIKPAVKITHVIHLEPSLANEFDRKRMEMLKRYMPPRAQQAHHWQSSMVSLQQLLLYCASIQASTASNSTAVPPPMTLLHVANPSLPSSPISRTLIHSRQILTDTYHALTNGRVALHHLDLPSLSGTNLVAPTMGTAKTNATADLHNEDALAAILMALQDHPQRFGLRHMTIAQTIFNHSSVTPAATEHATLRNLQTAAVNLNLQYPLGVNKRELAVAAAAAAAQTYPHGVHSAMNELRETFGMYQTPFPCATSCYSPTSPACQVSALDSVVPVSVAASAKCKYVAYLVDFSKDTKKLFKPAETGDDLCRLAFVSAKSPIVLHAVEKATGSAVPPVSRDEALRQHNGKLKSNGWKLIWLPSEDDEASLSDAELVLAIMEPSRLFASSVVKAMFTSSPHFAEPSDAALLRILERLDRPPLPKHARREHRSGITLSRFVPRPAEHGRTVMLFASEIPRDYRPKNVAAYARLAEADKITLPQSQINFYTQASHWIQSDHQRPDDDEVESRYKAFPFQWMSLGLLIHDLRYDTARTLRCAWYDEYLFWGRNRGAEELSLAFVMAMYRVEGKLAHPRGRLDDSDATWIPFSEGNTGRRAGAEEGYDAYLRLMTAADQGF